MNDVMINFKKMHRLFPERIKTAVERGWTLEEIQQMLRYCASPRSRAILFFEAASGGRVGVFEGLRMKHLITINDERFGKCYAIVGYAESREEYITFLTPEATKELDAYHESRKGRGETFTDETPIFLGIKRPDEIATVRGLANAMFNLQYKAGLRDPKTKKGIHIILLQQITDSDTDSMRLSRPVIY